MKLAAVVFTGFGVFVAHGGFSADVVALRGTGISRREARVRVMGLGALEYVLLAPAACASAIIILAHGSHTPNLGMTLPWAVCVPLGFVAAFWALRYHKKLSRAKGWRGALGHALDAVAVVRNLLCAPFKHGSAFLGMGLYWVGEIFSLSAALHAFGSPRPAIAALIIGYATGYALTRRTLPLAGAGVVEALLPFALVWVGAGLAAGGARGLRLPLLQPLAPAHPGRRRDARPAPGPRREADRAAGAEEERPSGRAASRRAARRSSSTDS